MLKLWRKNRSKECPEKEITVNAATSGSGVSRDLVIIPSNYQHKGARESQEDAFAFSNLEDEDLVKKIGVLAVLADGMGGLALGAAASSAAVNVFLKEYINKQQEEPVASGLNRALKKANTAVFDLALQDNGMELSLGTTLVAVVIYGDYLHWVSVGDSGIFLFREGTLSQLNKYHIYANHLQEDVQKKRITMDEAENHPERAHLTSYLGLEKVPEVDKHSQPLLMQPGDAVLLCSDGLSDALSYEEMAVFLKNGPLHAAETLVNLALSKNIKHQDNVTAVALKCQARG